MKLTISILSAALVLSTVAFAADDAGKPCMKIKQACEAAGFKKGGHQEGGKGLFADCMKKLAAGESVPGVNVSAEEVAACKEKHALRKEKREQRREIKAEGRAVHSAKPKADDAK